MAFHLVEKTIGLHPHPSLPSPSNKILNKCQVCVQML